MWCENLGSNPDLTVGMANLVCMYVCMYECM